MPFTSFHSLTMKQTNKLTPNLITNTKDFTFCDFFPHYIFISIFRDIQNSSKGRRMDPNREFLQNRNK